MQQFDDIFLIPKGNRTIFGAKKGSLVLDDTGFMKFTSIDGSYSETINLTNSKVKASFGTVRFTTYEGEKRNPVLIKGPYIYLFNPLLNFISVLLGLFKKKQAHEIADAINAYSKVE